MGAPTPCLGYPSRTLAVQALVAEGVPTREIADRIGITVKQVYALEASARRGPRSAPTGERRRPPPIAVSDVLPDDFDLRAEARWHAARRGLPIERFMREVFERLLRDKLVDAVMDDADELRAAS